MTPERYQKVIDIINDVEGEDGEARSLALMRLCGSDSALRAEVEALLEHRDLASGFLAATALGDYAELLLEGVGGAPAVLGHYRIEEEIGSGGMGIVYRGVDGRLPSRAVALKLVRQPPGRSSPGAIERLRREAEVLASIKDQRIVTIYAIEEAGGEPFLVMEYVEGEDLENLIRGGAVEYSQALAICAQVAEALSVAHRRSVVHRDLKPSNVVVQPDGTIKVLDFGLARAFAGADAAVSPAGAGPGLTAAGVIVGTPGYISPERYLHEAADHRADVWSFGCVLFACLAGRPPWDREDDEELRERVLHEEPDWARLPARTARSVRELLAHCLEKQPERRLQSLTAAATVLRDAIGNATDSGRRRRRRWSSLAALAVLVAVAVAVLAHDDKATRGPAGIRLSGQAVIAVDAVGEPLWQADLGRPLAAMSSERLAKRSAITDLDQDGRNEVAILPDFGDNTVPDDTLLLLDDDGSMLWRRELGRKRHIGERVVEDRYAGILVRSLGRSSRFTGPGRLAVVVNHLNGPYCRVVALDVNGVTLGEFWNRGHLQYSTLWDEDGDGQDELVVGGANNELAEAALVVLAGDGLFWGSSPPDSCEQAAHPMPAGFRRYVRFAPDVRPQMARNYVVELSGEDDRLEVTTSVDNVGLFYRLYRDGSSAVHVTDDYAGRHRALVARGELQGPLDAQFVEWLRRKARTWDGRCWAELPAP